MKLVVRLLTEKLEFEPFLGSQPQPSHVFVDSHVSASYADLSSFPGRGVEKCSHVTASGAAK